MEAVSSIWRYGRVPCAVKHRRRDINGQPRPGGSELECSRRSDRPDKSVYHRRFPVARDPAIEPRGGKIVQVAPIQRLRTRRADGGVARRHVVHPYELNRQFSNAYLAPRTPAPSFTGELVHCRLKHPPTGIAVLGGPLSETNRYLICIGDERTAKSEHVRRAGQALFQCSLRKAASG